MSVRSIYGGPLRRSTDKPSLPPSSPVANRSRAEVVDIAQAVGNKLQHFMLDSTKRRLFRDWMRGVSERQLQANYTDPRAGSPKREQIEEVLREQVLIFVKRAA